MPPSRRHPAWARFCAVLGAVSAIMVLAIAIRPAPEVAQRSQAEPLLVEQADRGDEPDCRAQDDSTAPVASSIAVEDGLRARGKKGSLFSGQLHAPPCEASSGATPSFPGSWTTAPGTGPYMLRDGRADAVAVRGPPTLA